MEHPPTTEHNYLAAVARFHAEHPELDGRYVRLEIRHENWCNQAEGGFCNCLVSITPYIPENLIRDVVREVQ